MSNLKSMVEFVLTEKEYANNPNPLLATVNILTRILNHAKLLSRKPTLGDFNPCDSKGKILSNPKALGKTYSDSNPISKKDANELQEWNKANERVLFKGFSVKKSILTNRNYVKIYDGDVLITFWNDGDIIVKWGIIETIEDLVQFKLELK